MFRIGDVVSDDNGESLFMVFDNDIKYNITDIVCIKESKVRNFRLGFDLEIHKDNDFKFRYFNKFYPTTLKFINRLDLLPYFENAIC